MSDEWEYEESDEDEDEAPPPTNGPNGLRIMAAQCSTCIFRPGNLMELNRGRLRDMVERTAAADTNVICHQTLDEPLGALCHGSVEQQPGQMARIAYRLNSVELIEPKP
jgi:hypothetical protein